MSAILSVEGAGGPREYALEKSLTIGRSADNDILLDGDGVSRRHAIVSPAPGGGFTFIDLGSANGSRIGGKDVAPREAVALNPGDAIQIGSMVLRLRAAGGGGYAGAVTSVLSNTPELEILVRGVKRQVPLVRERMTLGRDPGADIVVESDVVSRLHLVIRRNGPGFIVEDQGSTNGMTAGGVRVESRQVGDGDVLGIAGEVELRFHLPGAAGSAPASKQDIVQVQSREELLIGRGEECGLRLDHPTVSLRHVRLGAAGLHGERVVEDLGSTNGTFVDGVRLAPGERRKVPAGAAVDIGPVRLVVGERQIRKSDRSREIGLTAVGLNQRVSPQLNLLQDLSFVIKPQEFVAVVGVSGAGKSTLLGALSGFRPASDGDVMLNGSSLYDNFDVFRTSLGYVPQDDILHKDLPVGRALGYAAELRLPEDTAPWERERRVEEVIATLGLQERRGIVIGRLSGGQRKRVSIGAELLTRPGLFFLDEATSGLDPGTESQLMRLLRGLADDGHTIVLITHATKNVMLCDQVLFLAKGGNLAYYGPPDEALEYFGVKDFDGIYEKVEGEKSPEEWGRLYRASRQYQEQVVARLAEQGLSPSAAPARGSRSSAPPPAARATASSMRQLKVLARRYVDIITRDRVNLALLFLLAPALGLIDVVIWKRNLLAPQGGDATRSMTMFFLAALIPFLVGALSFVREIVKEAPIYSRERAVSLQVAPYLASKVVVAVPFALYHAATLFAIKWLIVDFPGTGPADMAMFYFTIVLAVLSGVMWALLISTLTGKEEQAMLLVIALVIVQMVFSGGLVPMSSLGVAGTVLGAITSTAWTFQALTAAGGVSTAGCTGDLSGCRLPGFSGLASAPERQLLWTNLKDAFGDVLDANVLVCWAAMGLIILVLASVLFVLQRRKDSL